MRLAGAHPRPAAAQPRPRCRLNRVVQHHWTAYGASPGLRDGFDYGYDANSNRLWRANLTAQALDKPFDELYAYDQLNRLVDFQRGTLNAEHTAILGTPTKEQTWNLDPTGNWSQFTSADDGVLETDQTRISNPANEITEISSWFPPGYDHAGNMTRIPKPAAPQEGFLATWDAWNRMVTLVDASTGDTVQENAYDPQTWRTVRKDYEAGSLSKSQHFFYTALWQCVEERLDSATTPERQHVWGLRYIDDLVLRDRDTDDDGDLDERLYAMQDANWNVTAIADGTGDVAERYAYSPFGTGFVFEPVWLERTISAFGWNYQFGTYQLSLNDGLLLARNRLLLSALGTWLSRDVVDAPGGMNLYAYCSGSPTIQTDPSGLVGLPLVIGGSAVVVWAICVHRQVEHAHNAPGSGDAWRHCNAACNIVKWCGGIPAGVALGTSKEAWDSIARVVGAKDAGDWLDSLDDFLTNGVCTYFEQWATSWLPIGHQTICIVSGWIHESCDACCDRIVGRGTNNFIFP